MVSRFLKLLLLLSVASLSLVANAGSAKQRILVFGDSLSAGHGIAQPQSWVALLQNKLDAEKYNVQVLNASLSGETTSGGLSRLAAALDLHKPNLIIIELGANDGFRGLPAREISKNLTKMIQLSQQKKIRVLLLSMKIPPNYGLKYTQQFSDIYPKLTSKFKLPAAPFLLQDVACNSELNQVDGIHPTAEAQPILLDNVWPTLKPLLK